MSRRLYHLRHPADHEGDAEERHQFGELDLVGRGGRIHGHAVAMMELSWWRHIAARVILRLVQCGAAAALRIDAAHALLAIHQIVVHVPLGRATASDNPEHACDKQIARHNHDNQQAACRGSSSSTKRRRVFQHGT